MVYTKTDGLLDLAGKPWFARCFRITVLLTVFFSFKKENVFLQHQAQSSIAQSVSMKQKHQDSSVISMPFFNIPRTQCLDAVQFHLAQLGPFWSYQYSKGSITLNTEILKIDELDHRQSTFFALILKSFPLFLLQTYHLWQVNSGLLIRSSLSHSLMAYSQASNSSALAN